jgi:hypothetical protein
VGQRLRALAGVGDVRSGGAPHHLSGEVAPGGSLGTQMMMMTTTMMMMMTMMMTTMMTMMMMMMTMMITMHHFQHQSGKSQTISMRFFHIPSQVIRERPSK